ncbi:MAG: hypothetical protein ACI4A3_03015 [Lachnospiraceae bacterium]
MIKKRSFMMRMAAIGMGITIAGTSIPLNVYAKESSNGKEEVVYVNLGEDGSVEGTYVVNIFTDKEVKDYGDYSQVHGMNTDDEITYENGVVTVTNSADRLYYEGVMEDAEIPWNFDISYTLDGKEITAQELAGKSGAFTLTIHVSENKNCKGDFFDNYALQATVKLDTTLCENIVCNGATEANAGNDKQMTYTILPGKSKDIEISADVTDFEMDAIAINGVRLNLDVSDEDIDTSKLEDKITDLQDAVAKLDDGAVDLNDGAKTVNKGSESLKTGIQTINKALKKLNKKSGSLTTGSGEVKTALKTIQTSLEGVSITTEQLATLSKSSTDIKNGIAGIQGGLVEMDQSIDMYYGQLRSNGINSTDEYVGLHNQALSAIQITETQKTLYGAYAGSNGSNEAVMAALYSLDNEEANALKAQAAAGDTGAVSRYVSNAGALIAAQSLLKGDIAYINGSSQLIAGIDASLDKDTGALMTGANQLKTGYEEFDKNIQSLVTSLGNLAVDMTNLKSGIDKLVTNYSALDTGIGEYTEAVNSITTGYSKICEGAVTLVKGTGQLYEGTQSMTEGTGTFRDETSDLQSDIDDEIDKMIDSFTGGDYEVESFVSDKNQNVEAVQFIIQTGSVKEKESEEEVEQEENKKGFIDKVKDLF